MGGKRNRDKVMQRREEKREKLGKEAIKPVKFQESRKANIIPLSAKSDNQKETLKAFTEKQLIGQFGTSGSGKTELACWWAAKQWLQGDIENIVITRPAKTLGKDGGAVPGGDELKLLNYCMPMLMKLKKYLGIGILRNNLKLDTEQSLFSEVSGIMIIPIEKIQGFSFDERTIIIADEFQNTDAQQAKAVVTRAEEGCQVLLCGDETQTALKHETNGITVVKSILEKYPSEDAQVTCYTPEDDQRKGIAGHMAWAFEQEGSW